MLISMSKHEMFIESSFHYLDGSLSKGEKYSCLTPLILRSFRMGSSPFGI